MNNLEIMTLTRINAYELVLVDLNKVPKKTRTAARAVMAQLLSEELTFKHVTKRN